MGEGRAIQYDAFISYRHLKKDRKIAVTLQKLLEKGKIKDADTGRKRNIHVFRDQSELPTSDNLGQDIRNALENSNFLILLCSRETKNSRYCMEEVRYFQSLHNHTNFHILPVLLEGEPDEVFPEPLRYIKRQVADEEGILHTVVEEVEPLAADVRAGSLPRMVRKLRSTEYMRLEAPILGVAYDALYNRRLRQRIRQGVAVGAAALTASLAFGFYNSHMLHLLAQKQNEILRNESSRLAAYAEDEMEDTKLSALLAQEACSLLPEGTEGKTEAENLLRSIVLQEEISQKRDCFHQQARIRFDTESWWISDSYAEGKRLAVTDFLKTYLYDTAMGQLLYQSNFTEQNYFNPDATLSVQLGRAEGNAAIVANGYDVATSEQIFTFEMALDPEEAANTDLFPLFDEESGDCYLVATHYTEGVGLDYDYPVCFGPDGSRTDHPFIPDERKEDVSENYLSYVTTEWSRLTDFTDGCLIRGDREEGVFSEEEEARWQDAEARGFYVYRSKVLEDEGIDVLLVSIGEGNSEWVSLLYSIWDQRLLLAMAGEADYDPDSGLFYFANHETQTLDIYSFHRENISEEEAPDIAFGGDQLNADGTRYISRKIAQKQADGILYELNIWDTADMGAPIWTGSAWGDPSRDMYLYFLTENMDYIIVSDCSRIEVWDVDRNLCLGSRNAETEDGEHMEITALSLNEDGTVVAAAYQDEGGKLWAEVRRIGGEETAQYIDLGEWFDGLWVGHMEFHKDMLLISSRNSSVVLSVNEEEEFYDTGQAKQFPEGNQNYFLPRYLTEDGLLFSTYMMNTPYALADIYDARTGESIFPGNGDGRAYSYDPETGFLVWADFSYDTHADSLHVAQRQADGAFRVIGEIHSRYVDMELAFQGPVQDREYLLLSGNGITEVYNLNTLERELVLLLDNLGIRNGKLYDLEAAGKAQGIGTPFTATMEEVKQKAAGMLSFGDITRELNEGERQRFFIKDL